MKPSTRTVRAFSGLLVSATAFTAWADPRATPRAAHALGGSASRLSAAAAASRPNAAAIAYLAGKQALVGLHAAADEAPARDMHGRAMLALRSVNRAEFLTLPVSTDEGGFDSVDLDRAAHLLRAASGDEHPVDPRTLAIVYRIQTHFGAPEIRVVSGYRVPKPGSRSNHGKGRAIDLIVPGSADEDVAKFAREMGFVGVGVYPRSQFVHVDIRPRSYFWVDYSGPHMKNRERGILGDLASHSDVAATARGEGPIEPFVLETDVDAALRRQSATDENGTTEEDDDDEN